MNNLDRFAYTYIIPHTRAESRGERKRKWRRYAPASEEKHVEVGKNPETGRRKMKEKGGFASQDEAYDAGVK